MKRIKVNNVTISGIIISDITLGETKKKKIPVANFRIMHNNSRLSHPLLVDIEAWGEIAQRLSNECKRKDFIVLEGELRRDVWVSKNSGDEQIRTKIKITATKIITLIAGDR